jgi:hypothetical protein
MPTDERGQARRGRPPGRLNGPPKQGISISLEPSMIAWVKEQPGGASATVRKCLEQMQRAAEQQRE